MTETTNIPTITYSAIVDDNEILIHRTEEGRTDGLGTLLLIKYTDRENGDTVEDVLSRHGWHTVGDWTTTMGYPSIQVSTSNLYALIVEMTRRRDLAQLEAARADEMWRNTIRDAYHRREIPTHLIAEAAGVTRARVYQIRDNRR